MSDIDDDRSFETSDGVWLTLLRVRRTDGTTGRDPVLLLHGASANHLTFTTPNGGVADWLLGQNYDPWLLNWRGSGLVVDDPRNAGSLANQPAIYNFSNAAAFDVPAAIAAMRQRDVDGSIGVLGFCMGAAVVAEAIARGTLDPQADIDRIVLMTLGLFYDAPIEGRLKSEERVLETLARTTVDPRLNSGTWEPALEDLFGAWPSALRAHPEASGRDAVTHLCNRLSFMYGMPYHHPNLARVIHDDPTLLPTLFGAIPVKMFIHGANNLRAGEAQDRLGDTAPLDGTPRVPIELVSDDSRARFHTLGRITLITGALNRLWHRNSIDRMEEWLRRGPRSGRTVITKRVFPGYGHQDLLWGERASDEVYPTIEAGLKALDTHAATPYLAPPRLPDELSPSKRS